MVARRGTGTLRVLAVPSSVHNVFAGAGLEPGGATGGGLSAGAPSRFAMRRKRYGAQLAMARLLLAGVVALAESDGFMGEHSLAYRSRVASAQD